MISSTPEWIARSVSRLRTAAPAADKAGDKLAKAALDKTVTDVVAKVAVQRSTHERLQATLRRGQEALSPRALRRLLADLQEVVAPQVSEIEGGRRAQVVAEWYAKAEPEERRDMWLLMCEQFAPDATRFKSARQRYEAAAGTAEEGQAEISLRRALVSPRTRLLQRFSAFPEGMRFLVDMRAEILPLLKADKRLLPLDAELEHLFSTWFDVAFLELRRLSWDSPASLLEKLIKYEAVHDIRSWADLKNRLDSDRRCYGFFHPRLPGEPLIFVEVALLDKISSSITPLLDEAAAPVDITRATTAIFYSISNTQTGLRGVSFGDSLIKHVVETRRTRPSFRACAPLPRCRPSRVSALGWANMQGPCWIAWTTSAAANWGERWVSSRRRPPISSVRWTWRWRWTPNPPCARCCWNAPRTIWAASCKKASRQTPWPASTWATARG